VGFALFFHNFSTFLGKAGIYLEYLYVKPEYRGRGYGEGLSVAAAVWNGGALIRTGPASAFTCPWVPSL